MAKRKKRANRKRTANKSNVKAQRHALPQKRVLKMLTTALWILSGLSGVVAAVAFAAHYKYAGLLASYVALCLGLGAIVTLIWEAWTNSDKKSAPRISVVSEVWIHNAERDKIGFFVLSQWGKNVVAFPINDLRYVHLTNDGSLPLMIDFITVEVTKDGKRWTPATLIDVAFMGKLYWVDNNGGLAKSTEMKLLKPELKDAVKDKNIGSGETVKGWLCIERPPGFDEINTRWRVRLRNMKGEQGFSKVIGVDNQRRNETMMSAELYVVGKDIDLTDVKFCFFSEAYKLPR